VDDLAGAGAVDEGSGDRYAAAAAGGLLHPGHSATLLLTKEPVLLHDIGGDIGEEGGAAGFVFSEFGTESFQLFAEFLPTHLKGFLVPLQQRFSLVDLSFDGIDTFHKFQGFIFERCAVALQQFDILLKSRELFGVGYAAAVKSLLVILDTICVVVYLAGRFPELVLQPLQLYVLFFYYDPFGGQGIGFQFGVDVGDLLAAGVRRVIGFLELVKKAGNVHEGILEGDGEEFNRVSEL